MEKIAFLLYLIVLVLSPLLFGAVHTYAYSIITFCVLICSLLLIVKNLKKNLKTNEYRFHIPAHSLNLLSVAMLIFLIFQIFPMPVSILNRIAPEAVIAGEKSLSASAIAGNMQVLKDFLPISSYFYPTRMSIIRFSVYILFLLGFTQVLNSKGRIETAIFIIILTGCFESIYGLIQTFTGLNHIWWFRRFVSPGFISGTYINKNHFAGFMELCLVLSALYAVSISGMRREKTFKNQEMNLNLKMRRLLSGEQRFNKRLFILVCGAVIGIGLVFSGSRGGLIASAGALMFISLIFLFKKRYRNKGLIILILFLMISAYALKIGVDEPVERFRNMDISYQERARLARNTLEIFSDNRLVGIGIGNFQYVYPKYQSKENTNIYIQYAHNDWIQFLSEAGIIGSSLLVIGVFYYLYATFRLWKIRRDPFAVCLGMSSVAALISVAIHSYSDFNLHIPANFLLLTAILAIGHSALHMKRPYLQHKPRSRFFKIPIKYRGVVLLLILLVVILWDGIWAFRHLMAESYCNTVYNSTLNRDQNPPLDEIRKAIEWDKWNAGYRYKLALELRRLEDSKASSDMSSLDLSETGDSQIKVTKALEKAVSLNPFKIEYHLRSGWEYTRLWKNPDYFKIWLPAADISMERAVYFMGDSKPHIHLELGNYWILRSKTMNPIDIAWEPAWKKAIWHYKEAQKLSGSSSLVKNIEEYIWKFYPDREMVNEAILHN